MISYRLSHSLTKDEIFIRRTVFVEEQGFKTEFDNIDGKSVHMVMYKDSLPIACLRYYRESSPGEYTIGRIAVLKEYRGQNYGVMIMEEAQRQLKNAGCTQLGLSAQVRACGFYRKLGYKEKGKIYFDEHCEHIHMEKEL